MGLLILLLVNQLIKWVQIRKCLAVYYLKTFTDAAC